MSNFGNLVETNIVDFFKMAEAGYVVIATKTRFPGINGKFDQHSGSRPNCQSQAKSQSTKKLAL
jgi:hypothetical protein